MSTPSTCRCGLILFSLAQLVDMMPAPARKYLRAPCGHCDRPCPDGDRCRRCQRIKGGQ